tara:strand:+ start:22403 stop:22675 length:273 start_codon:yes stop_codon:yes gene_type:complete
MNATTTAKTSSEPVVIPDSVTQCIELLGADNVLDLSGIAREVGLPTKPEEHGLALLAEVLVVGLIHPHAEQIEDLRLLALGVLVQVAPRV